MSVEKKAKQKQARIEQKEKMAELIRTVATLQAQLDVAHKQLQEQETHAPIPASVPDSPAVVLEQTEVYLPNRGADPSDIPPVPVDVNTKVKHIIEALLFAAEEPMSVKQLHAVFPEIEAPDKKNIQQAIDALSYDYREQAISLHQVASGYRFQVRINMAPWVARLFAEKPPKYSRALLETIAIIAYQQPVTRGNIEEIRGVSVSSNMIRTLLDREWIKVLGHKEVPGRPALYGTTKQFLDYFNLSSLDAMPALEELQALAIEGELEI